MGVWTHKKVNKIKGPAATNAIISFVSK